MELPGLPPEAVKLIAGYQLDVLATDVEHILVTLAVGKKLHWMFSIEEPETKIVPMPTPTAAPPRPAAVASAIKKDKQQNEPKG